MDGLTSSRAPPLFMRMAAVGATALSDAELVAGVIGGSDAAVRAQQVLAEVGGAVRLAQAGVAELARSARLGELRACRLKAALELGRRAIDQPLERGAPIRSAADVDARLRGRLVGLEQEELHVLGLDTLHRVVVHFVAGVGGVNQVYASPRDVFRPLVREAAHAAIVVHNHPSGLADPSGADAELTLEL